MYWPFSLLSLDDVTILIFLFDFRNYFFRLHKSVLQLDVPELIGPKEDASGGCVGGCECVWCLFTVAIFLQPAATFVAAWFVVAVFL